MNGRPFVSATRYRRSRSPGISGSGACAGGIGRADQVRLGRVGYRGRRRPRRQRQLNGLLLAEKTIYAKGGFKGRPIRILIEDDTSNPDTAVTKVNDLIFNQKVIAIFGGSLLGPAVAMGGITDGAKIPQLTFTGLGPAVERNSEMRVPHAAAARAETPVRCTSTRARSAPARSACCTIPATATW